MSLWMNHLTQVLRWMKGGWRTNITLVPAITTTTTTTSYLIRFIEQTQTVAHPQRIYIIRLAAVAELVRLDILEADNLLGHDATVPVPADALLSCGRELKRSAFQFTFSGSAVTTGFAYKGHDQGKYGSANFLRLRPFFNHKKLHNDNYRLRRSHSQCRLGKCLSLV